MAAQAGQRFNSKLVRLKGEYRNSMAGQYQFQFQTGAIKSCKVLWHWLFAIVVFQFQTGAIKS